MSNITSYLSKDGNYQYKRLVFQAATNASETANSQDVSGSSGASSTTDVNNILGASGEYVWVSIGEVKNLTIEELVQQFREGNLTKEEMDKWINAHLYDIKNLEKSEDKGMYTYKFTYRGKYYEVACSKEAAESQLDKITSQTYTMKLIEKCNFTKEQIAKYFVLASFGYGDW